jgi:hypothetical protein
VSATLTGPKPPLPSPKRKRPVADERAEHDRILASGHATDEEIAEGKVTIKEIGALGWAPDPVRRIWFGL